MNSAEQQRQVAEVTRITENSVNGLKSARELIAKLMNTDRANQSNYAGVYSALNRAIREASVATATLTVI